MGEDKFSALEFERTARQKTDEAYKECMLFVTNYEELRNLSKKGVDLKAFAKKYWPQITAGAAMFGIPLGAADSGAFAGILGVLGNFWPF